MSLQHVVFDEWSLEVERVVREYLNGLKVGECTEVMERADETNTSPIIGLTKDECISVVMQWFQSATKFASQILENEELDFISHRLNVCADDDLLDVDAVMIRTVLGRTSQSQFGAGWVQRASLESYNALFETAEQWRDWEADEVRFARTPLETLLATGEVQLLDSSAGSLSTPGHEGRTYYDGQA